MAALVSAYKDCTFSGSVDGSKPRSGSKIALIPTARSMASRATAKISGVSSEIDAPSARRLRNSPVLALISASVSGRTEDSNSLTCLANRK